MMNTRCRGYGFDQSDLERIVEDSAFGSDVGKVCYQ
jgi:hypothetical protein